jgi:hypothetical protein
VLERLTKDVDRRLEALDKRVDAIQAVLAQQFNPLVSSPSIKLNQSQAQTLQIQTQTLHTIQDQQGTIITALMPLLPLLQAVPLHIESARNGLNDTIVKSSRNSVHTSIEISPARASRIRGEKRSSSTLRSDGLVSPSPLPNKRLRMAGMPQGPDKSSSRTGATLVIKEAQAGQSPTGPNLQREDPPQGSYRPLSASVASSCLNQTTNPITAHFKTSRRPLAELYTKTQIPTATLSLTRASTSRPIGTSRPPGPLSSPDPTSPPRVFAITPSTQGPPRLLRVHSSVSEVVGTVHVHVPPEVAPKLGLGNAIEEDQNPPPLSLAKPGVELTSRISLAPPRPTETPRASPSLSVPPSITVHRPIPRNPIVTQPDQAQVAAMGTPLSLLINKEPRLTRSSMKPIPMGSMGIRERQLPFVSCITAFWIVHGLMVNPSERGQTVHTLTRFGR